MKNGGIYGCYTRGNGEIILSEQDLQALRALTEKYALDPQAEISGYRLESVLKYNSHIGGKNNVEYR